MFETSATTEKLDAAMAKAQAQIQAAVKDKVNPAFRSKYADLASVWEACRDALTKNGISITQWPVHSEDGRLHLITRLAVSGEWLKAQSSMPVVKQDPHGYMSATKYLKRSALAACVGVVADEDDDGNAAAGKDKAPEQKPAAPDAEGKKLLEGAQTLAALADAWKALPPAARATLGSVKDQCKSRLMKAEEATQA
jgi:hypothetical protein